MWSRTRLPLQNIYSFVLRAVLHDCEEKLIKKVGDVVDSVWLIRFLPICTGHGKSRTGLPGTFLVGPLVWRPGGQLRQMLKVGQTTFYINRGSVRRERRKVSEGQSHKEEEIEGGSRTGEGVQGPLASEEWLYLDICARVPEFLVTPLLMGPVCLLSRTRFEEPVRPWSQNCLETVRIK